MPLNIQEALTDIPAVLGLLQKIETGLAALPATGRTAKDYSSLICSVLPDLAALVDQIETQIKS